MNSFSYEWIKMCYMMIDFLRILRGVHKHVRIVEKKVFPMLPQIAYNGNPKLLTSIFFGMLQ